MAEPGAPRTHRLYGELAVAKALGIEVPSVRDRLERGSSLRGWPPEHPDNTVGAWLIDADFADLKEPRKIGEKGLPSFTGDFPPLGPLPGPGTSQGDPLANLSVQHELARSETQVMEDLSKQLAQIRRENRKLKAILVTAQEALAGAHAAEATSAKALDAMLAAEVVALGDEEVSESSGS